MRFGYVGNFSAQFSTENEYRKAIEANGWQCVPVQEGDPAALAVLTASVRDFDVVMWTRTRDLAEQVGHKAQWALIEACERAGVPLVGVHLDRWIGLRREREIPTEPYFRVPLLLTADGGHQDRWAELGCNHRWLPPGVSEFECIPGTPREEWRSDLGFIGSWDGYGHQEAWHRPALVQWLRDNYGDRVAFWPKRGEHAVRGDDLRVLIASVKLWVGDSCVLSREEADTRGFYWSDRVPELTGRGAVLAHPDTKGLADEHFTVIRWGMGEFDGDPIGLRGVIEDWLGRSDDEVRLWGELGRDHTLMNHTYTVRCREIVGILEDEGML